MKSNSLLSYDVTNRLVMVTPASDQAASCSEVLVTCPGCWAWVSIPGQYIRQMIMTPGGFSAAGDSGSLVLHRTHQDSSNQVRPVELLFAGSSTSTVGNRISDVLEALSSVIATL
jgi:hypothetical protein